MNFLMYVHGFVPTHNAGAERYLFNLGRALIERGHAVRVITGRGMLGAFNGVHEGIEIRTDPGHLIELGAVQWADVLITHLDRSRRSVELSQRHGKPLMYIVHNPWSLGHFKIKPDEAQLVVFNSAWLQAESKWQGRSVVCPPLLRIGEFGAVEAAGPGRGHVTLSNLNANKGGDLFWKLARAIPGASFFGIKGYGDQRLQPRGEELRNVTISENRADVREVLRETRVLIMPSDFESWGMMGLEAMACGIPVIANPTQGLIESLGEAAIFLPRGKPEAWKAEIQRLLHDDVHHQELAAAGLARAEHIAQLGQEWVDALEEQITEICQQRKRIRDRFGTWCTLQCDETEKQAWLKNKIRPVKRSFVCFFSRMWALKRWFERFNGLELDRDSAEFLAVIDSADLPFIEAAINHLEAMRGFARVRILITGNRPLYDDREVRARRARIVSLWAATIPELAGQETICIEDDTLPIAPTSIRTLLRAKRQLRANFIQGTEVGRWSHALIPHWQVTRTDGKIVHIASGLRPPKEDSPIVPIQGCGWYCFVADTRMLQEVPMRLDEEVPLGPDLVWGSDCSERGFKMFGHWGVPCEHFTTKKTLSPDAGGLQQVTWKLERGGRWIVNGKPMGMKISHGKKLGGSMEQKKPEKASAANGGILVRAKRTWVGEEGTVFAGQELRVTPSRHTHLSQKGWVETIAVPDAGRRQAPLEADAPEEKVTMPDFLSDEAEEKITPNAPKRAAVLPNRTAAPKKPGDSPKAQKAATVDRSRPIHAGATSAPNACKKCARSFKTPGDLAKHLDKEHAGGK